MPPGPGVASKGFLCVYDIFASSGITFDAFTNPSAPGDPGTSRDGVGMVINSNPNYSIEKGVWALTAP
jgi:hypothetical protein